MFSTHTTAEALWSRLEAETGKSPGSVRDAVTRGIVAVSEFQRRTVNPGRMSAAEADRVLSVARRCV